MLVFDRAVVHELAILATRGNHRDFALEVDEGLQLRFLTPDRVPPLGHVIRRLNSKLAFAVVTKSSGLEDRRTAEFKYGLLQLVQRTDFAIRGNRQSRVFQKRLLANALLRSVEN